MCESYFKKIDWLDEYKESMRSPSNALGVIKLSKSLLAIHIASMWNESLIEVLDDSLECRHIDDLIGNISVDYPALIFQLHVSSVRLQIKIGQLLSAGALFPDGSINPLLNKEINRVFEL